MLYSLSKSFTSFTSVAVGLAVTDGLLEVNDRVVDVLADHVPDDAPPAARQLNLTVTGGGCGSTSDRP